MKLTFILFAFFFNFFNPFFLKAEEIIDSSNMQPEINSNEESSINVESDFKTIHIVKIGDTITSISKLYSIDKKLIIKLNDLKDENYIYVGQNLKISDANQITKNNADQKIYHLVQKGDNLTEISLKYGLDLKYLKEINNLDNQDSIDVGSKLFLSKNNMIDSTKSMVIKDEEVNKTYGPITIQQNEFEKVNSRKILNALNQNNKRLILSVNCETKVLDVRIPGRKWRGWMPAKEEFEKNLINDFC